MNLLLRPYRGCSKALPAAIVLAVASSLLLAVDARAQPPAGAKPARAPMTTVELAKRLPGTIVTIVGERGLGSGVIVDPSGVIVTNLHVLRGETTVSVKLANGDIYDDVSVVDVDARKDLLILRIKAVGLAHATVGNSETVNVGERVVAVGSPQGLERTVSDGIVSAVRDSGDGYRLFQTNAAASPGSSGGGLFNLRGELIGIVSAKLSSGENLNFSVPINYARGLIATTPRMTLTELAATYPAENTAGAAADADVEPSEEQNRRLADLTKQTGLPFETVGGDGWSTAFEGNYASRLTVFAYVHADFAVVQSLVQEDFTNARLEDVSAMLRMSFGLNVAKFVVGPSGQLWAMSQTELRLLDGPGLKLMAQNVATAADEALRALGSATSDEASPAPVAPSANGAMESIQLLNNHLTIRFSPSEWQSEQVKDKPGHHKLTHASNTVFIVVMADPEASQVSPDKLPDIARVASWVGSARAKERGRGARLINGVSMSYLEFDATANGMTIRCLAHFYGDTRGSAQIGGCSSPDAFETSRASIERVVASFVVNR